jgi:hypothetical protein
MELGKNKVSNSLSHSECLLLEEKGWELDGAGKKQAQQHFIALRVSVAGGERLGTRLLIIPCVTTRVGIIA